MPSGKGQLGADGGVSPVESLLSLACSLTAHLSHPAEKPLSLFAFPSPSISLSPGLCLQPASPSTSSVPPWCQNANSHTQGIMTNPMAPIPLSKTAHSMQSIQPGIQRPPGPDPTYPVFLLSHKNAGSFSIC